MHKKLSVILPVYNGMPYLPQAVESILQQTLADFNFIIVNDGSTDGTGDYLRTIIDPRVVVIEQKNAGQGAARKFALSRCQSDYVALMDSDDVSYPNRLELQMAYLENHPEVVLVGTQIDLLIEGRPQKALSVPMDHEQIHARLMEGRAGLCNPCVMFRTKEALNCCDYPNGLLGEDIDFCLRMSELGTIANINMVLFQYRMHAAQTSLSRVREIVRANSYAAYLATCRSLGKPMPTFGEFVLHASWKDRRRWTGEARTVIQYRTGRLELATGHHIRGYLRLMLLTLRKPGQAVRRVLQTMKTSVTISSA
jgi:glycosyltransferase involved in cell wall biosynthesis